MSWQETIIITVSVIGGVTLACWLIAALLIWRAR